MIRQRIYVSFRSMQCYISVYIETYVHDMQNSEGLVL